MTQTSSSKSTIFSTLSDSGATESYQDYQAAAPFAVQWHPYPQPITLRLFDCQTSLAGPKLHYLNPKLSFLPKTSSKSVNSSVTKLEGSNIVLRAAWISSNQVTINWSHSNIVLPSSSPSPGPEDLPHPQVLAAIPRPRPRPNRYPCTYPNNIPLPAKGRYGLPKPTLPTTANHSAIPAVIETIEQ